MPGKEWTGKDFTKSQSLARAGGGMLIGARHKRMALFCALPSASEVGLSDPPKLREPNGNVAAEISSVLVADVRALINAARYRAAQAVNTDLVLLY